MQSKMIRGLILTLLSSVTYGMLSILSKLSYEAGMEVMNVLATRFLFASGFLLIFLLRKNYQLLFIKISQILILIGMSFILSLLSFLGFETIKHLPVSTAVLIFYLNPIIVTLFSIIFFKMKISQSFFWSLYLSTIGLAFVFYEAFSQNLNWLGLGLAFSTLITSSIYLILIQKIVNKIHPLTIAFYVLFYSGIIFSIFINPENLGQWQGKQFLLALSLGLFPTAISGALFYMAIQLIGSVYASLFSSFEPIFAIITAHFILGENIFNYQLVGAVFITASIALPSLLKYK